MLHTSVLIAFFLLLGCGGRDNPFKIYSNTPAASIQNEEALPETNENSTIKYVVDLKPLGLNLNNVSGSVDILIDETDFESTTILNELPHTLTLSGRMLSLKSCTEIAESMGEISLPEVMTEYKEVRIVDQSSREALIWELNRMNPSNGDNVDLTGKSWVVKAFDEGSGGVKFVACGSVERKE